MTDSNINIQMNYWPAEMTNIDVTRPLFDYFEVSSLFLANELGIHHVSSHLENVGTQGGFHGSSVV